MVHREEETSMNGLTPSRHAKAYEVFLRACDLPERERAAYLLRECDGDDALRELIEAMLSKDVDDVRAAVGGSEGGPEVTVTHDSGSRVRSGAPVSGKASKALPTIDGYKIREPLGQGGMGIVYRAVQKKLDREVALKFLPALLGAASPASVSRFRREAVAAARLHHTHIVPIYDYGECRDGYYYAMELIKGSPLSSLIPQFDASGIATANAVRVVEIIKTANSADVSSEPAQASFEAAEADVSGTVMSTSTGQGKPYYRQVATWMADVADALEYAHREGIVHRDIKPGNLLLSTDGRIMVADFGLAKSAEEASVTVTGSLVGTLRYISPEQAMAKRVRVDHRTDIYSLGATMYELLCLTPAFPGTDEKEILGAVISRDPTSPRKIDRYVPHALETVCMKCLEKNPGARYQTAKALADDLRRFLHDVPILATPPSFAERIWKFIKRQRTMVIGVVAVMLGMLLIGTLWTLRSTRVQKTDSDIRAIVESAANAVSEVQWDEAESQLRTALAMAPDRIDTLNTFIWMKLTWFKADPTQATVESLNELVDICERVIAQEPDNAYANNYLSIILKKLGRTEEAIEVARRIVAHSPEDIAVWTNLGAYHAVAGDLPEARKCTERAVELLEAKDTVSLNVRVIALRNLAAVELHLDQQAALGHIERAIELERDNPQSWLIRARARLDLSSALDPERAYEYAGYADVLALEKDPKAKRLRALAHLRNGDFARARVQSQLAIDLDRKDAVSYLIQAVACAKLGNDEDARTALARSEALVSKELLTRGFSATYDDGFLWLESADELSALRDEAAALLGSGAP